MIRRFKNVVIETVCRLMTPFLQLFGLYVIAHGHYSPGGGFQGGCILGSSFILMAISYDIDFAKKYMSEIKATVYACLGVIIYGGIGMVCLLIGANYLDYGILHTILPVDLARARAMGILGIEIGVGITVMAVMVSIYLNLVSGGRHVEEKVE